MEVGEKFAFIIMPFEQIIYSTKEGDVVKLNRQELDYLYNEFILKSLESFPLELSKIYAKRYESQSGNFIKGIVNDLFKADLVIAEITGLNPNVMYELGIRHTLKNNTILIAQDKTQIPSDLSQYLAVLYKVPSKPSEYKKCYEEFETKMHEVIKERLKRWSEADNPVRDFLEIKNKFRNDDRIKELVGNLNILQLLIKGIERVASNCQKAKSEWEKNLEFPIPHIDDDWAYFYQYLLREPKDFVIGKYIYDLSNNLKVLANNIEVFNKQISIKNKLPQYANATEIYLELPSYPDYQYHNVMELDLKDNPIVNGLILIQKQWDSELTELNSLE